MTRALNILLVVRDPYWRGVVGYLKAFRCCMSDLPIDVSLSMSPMA